MKTYRLSKDIANPEYDKRCKYGIKQYATFKAGTFFEGKPINVPADYLRVEAAYACNKDWHIQGDTAALLIDNSVESEPNTWDEIAIIGGAWHHMAGDVVQAMLDNGIVSIDQVKAALNQSISN